jgi:hypothetical protein
VITNRSCGWGLRSAEAVPGLSDEAHSRAATASTRSKVRVGARSNNSIQDLAAKGVPRSWQVRVLTSWLTRASGLADGRLGLGGITRYRVAALTGHGLPKAELACGASACTPVGQIIHPCADSIGQ